jgi:uncharacterized protein (DUF302 family)
MKMHMKKTFTAFVAGVMLATTAHAADHFAITSKKGKFEDVRDDIVMAIQSRGMKINHINHISDMLNRTGEAVGDTSPVFGMAEQIEFCKADLSRDMMQADPTNIVFCPYSIAVYTLPNAPDQVYVLYRHPVAVNSNPDTARVLKSVEDLLSGIVGDAVNGGF